MANKNKAAQTAREIISATIGRLNSVAGALSGARKIADEALAKMPEGASPERAALESARGKCDETIALVNSLKNQINTMDKHFPVASPAETTQLKRALRKIQLTAKNDLTVKAGFQEDEPRDEEGRWTAGGADIARQRAGTLEHPGHDPFSSTRGVIKEADKHLLTAETVVFALMDALSLAGLVYKPLRAVGYAMAAIHAGIVVSRSAMSSLHGGLKPKEFKKEDSPLTIRDVQLAILDSILEAKAEKELSAPDAAREILALMKKSLSSAIAKEPDKGQKAQMQELLDSLNQADPKAIDQIPADEAPALNQALAEMRAELAQEVVRKFDPSQPRADDGEWTSGGATRAAVASTTTSGTARNPHTVQVLDPEYVRNTNMADLTGSIARYSAAVAVGAAALTKGAIKFHLWKTAAVTGSVAMGASALAGYTAKRYAEAKIAARLQRPLEAKSEEDRALTDLTELVYELVKGELEDAAMKYDSAESRDSHDQWTAGEVNDLKKMMGSHGYKYVGENSKGHHVFHGHTDYKGQRVGEEVTWKKHPKSGEWDPSSRMTEKPQLKADSEITWADLFGPEE